MTLIRAVSTFSLPHRKDDTLEDIDRYSKFFTKFATGVDARRLHTTPKFEDVSLDQLQNLNM